MGAAAGLVGIEPLLDWDEPTWQRWVVATARANGWRVRIMDVRSGRGQKRGHKPDRGWPDLLLVKGRDLFWFELKPAKGKLDRDQVEVIGLLREAGQPTFILRPEDWENVLKLLA